jgi:hypothetical protein
MMLFLPTYRPYGTTGGKFIKIAKMALADLPIKTPPLPTINYRRQTIFTVFLDGES